MTAVISGCVDIANGFGALGFEIHENHVDRMLGRLAVVEGTADHHSHNLVAGGDQVLNDLVSRLVVTALHAVGALLAVVITGNDHADVGHLAAVELLLMQDDRAGVLAGGVLSLLQKSREKVRSPAQFGIGRRVH